MPDSSPHGLITISVYRRNHEIVQIETRHASADSGYLLTCSHQPDGTTTTETFDTHEALHDRLRTLGQELFNEGWVLMPRERRGMNRLPVPHCSTCRRSDAVEVVARTNTDVYFGCATCGSVWPVAKPGGLRPR